MAVNIDATILCAINALYISHHSISSQSSSIAGNETVLFILMVTALEQTDEEENRDENSQHETVSTQLHQMQGKNTKS